MFIKTGLVCTAGHFEEAKMLLSELERQQFQEQL